jgi:hypothetical protein
VCVSHHSEAVAWLENDRGGGGGAGSGPGIIPRVRIIVATSHRETRLAGKSRVASGSPSGVGRRRSRGLKRGRQKQVEILRGVREFRVPGQQKVPGLAEALAARAGRTPGNNNIPPPSFFVLLAQLRRDCQTPPVKWPPQRPKRTRYPGSSLLQCRPSSNISTTFRLLHSVVRVVRASAWTIK